MSIKDNIEIENNETLGAAAEVEVEQIENNNGFDFSILMTPTGEGAIEDYLDHPLNFNKSHGMAQILRGLTGIVGDLKLAIIDIGLGTLRLFKEKKVVSKENEILKG